MSYGAARIVGFLNRKADVYVPNTSSGRYDQLVKSGVACRLMPTRTSQQTRNPASTQGDQRQEQEIAWDPAYPLPGDFVHFVIGADRWVLVRDSDEEVTGRTAAVAYRRGSFVLQMTQPGS